MACDPASWGAETERGMRMQIGRNEKRIARTVAVELSRLGGSLPGETTFTENVSPHGARVWTKQRWQPEERVLLSSPETGLHTQARVVYCQRMENKGFPVGLELSAPVEGWTKPH
jgi:PilZ domain-containing protein